MEQVFSAYRGRVLVTSREIAEQKRKKRLSSISSIIVFASILVGMVVLDSLTRGRCLATLEDFRNRWDDEDIRKFLWGFLHGNWCSCNGPFSGIRAVLWMRAGPLLPRRCIRTRLPYMGHLGEADLEKFHNLSLDVLGIGEVRAVVSCGNLIYIGGSRGIACLQQKSETGRMVPIAQEQREKHWLFTRWCVRFNLDAKARLCCDLDGRLFALEGRGRLTRRVVCISASGQVLWSRHLPLSSVAIPLLITPLGNLVVVGEKQVFCLDRDGEVLWHQEEHLTPEAACAAWDSKAILFAGKGRVWARDSDNGEIIWTTSLKAKGPVIRLAAWHDRVFVATSHMLFWLDTGGTVLANRHIKENIIDLAVTMTFFNEKISPYEPAPILLLVLTSNHLLAFDRSLKARFESQHRVSHPLFLLAMIEEAAVVGPRSVSFIVFQRDKVKKLQKIQTPARVSQVALAAYSCFLLALQENNHLNLFFNQPASLPRPSPFLKPDN